MESLILPREIDYNTESFLNEMAQTAPEKVIKLLLKRIDHCISTESIDTSSHYSPIPHEFRSPALSVDSDLALCLVLEWTKNTSNAWQVAYFGEKLLSYIKLPGLFLYKAIANLLSVDYDVNERTIGMLVRALPKEFLWVNYENVLNILSLANKNGQDCFEKVKSNLFGIALDGTKSGSVGQPFPSDIELRDNSKIVLEKLSPASIGYSLYSGLYNYAVQEIDRANDRF
jgi:hypothetical protein